MIKFSIIADSLGMPRKEGTDLVRNEYSWPVNLELKLRNSNKTVYFHNASKRARMSNDIDHYENVELINPDFIVIQIGIVDCMPRLFTLGEKFILKTYLPGFISKKIIEYYSKRRYKIINKKPLKKVYIKPDNFQSNFERFFQKIDLSHVKIAIVPIVANLVQFENKSPGCSKIIQNYNSILENLCERYNLIFIKDFYTKLDSINMFCSDYYHLNENGNLFLSQLLYDKICETYNWNDKP